MDQQRVHGASQPVIALRVSFTVVLVIEVIRIPAADMDRPCHMVWHIVEAALQPLHTKTERVFDLPCKERLINLDMAAAGIDQRQSFLVHGRHQISGEGGLSS